MRLRNARNYWLNLIEPTCHDVIKSFGIEKLIEAKDWEPSVSADIAAVIKKDGRFNGYEIKGVPDPTATPKLSGLLLAVWGDTDDVGEAIVEFEYKKTGLGISTYFKSAKKMVR